uniref:Uncharacterized protein n=1 Tax=Prevotella sp. GTC17259 TaxID=3236795 RepID=A0AB33J1R4_9BACT
MGTIKGLEFSDTRKNDDGEREYYIDDWDDWFTVDEIKDRLAEEAYWENDFAGDVYEANDGFDWSD